MCEVKVGNYGLCTAGYGWGMADEILHYLITLKTKGEDKYDDQLGKNGHIE